MTDAGSDAGTAIAGSALLHAALASMPYGFTIWDESRRLALWNDAYLEMYHLPRERIRAGMGFRDIAEISVTTGDHATLSVDEIAALYTDRFRHEAGRRVVEHRSGGRDIRTIITRMPGLGWVSTHQDISEDRHREELIRHLARHDALTDLPNRVFFGEEMARLGERLEQGKASVALLCIDLDRFKLVNDTLGHAAGDRVLVTSARLLREAVRDGDIVARLGGDEFAVLTGPLADPAEAGDIAQRIVGALAEPLAIDGNQIAIGASVGIAVAPRDGADIETLFRNADLALYCAKRDGRGTYHFFERGMDEALRERRTLEAGLRLAPERGELRLVFQPVVNLADNRIASVEALLRWDHPERGPIAPAEFIPIAEETGLIVEIGAWVLAEAARAAARWPQNVRIAVNFSVAQFRGPDLVGMVETALRRAGLPAHRLELEITESLLLSDTEATFALLHRLRDMGVRIAMDDFGTGYSSLSYLHRFPFDKIKIDRSFMPDLSEAEGTSPIVEAMIGLGRSLGMTTTAEGVETEAQLELVRRQGCSEAQGFLFSPPLPASAIEALLRSSRAGERLRLTA